jgi:hypothetical protein
VTARPSSARQVAGDKRAHSMMAAEDDLGSPRLSLATVLPLSVWQDHLTPFLRRSEAARLRGVCKALRGVMDECPVKLGDVTVYKLREALICFPAAESLALSSAFDSIDAAEEARAVEVLRAFGGGLKHVGAGGGGGSRAQRVISSAVRAGALPRLSVVHLDLYDPAHAALLADGLLAHLPVEEVEVCTTYEGLWQLEPLRHLPLLRRLSVGQEHAFGSRAPIIPPFIPPSLKALSLDVRPEEALGSLLRELPSMLQASGASLDEIKVARVMRPSAESGAAFARVLRLCSTTLKIVSLAPDEWKGALNPAFTSEVALGLVSCCDRLERLCVPWEVFCSLPPTCPTFTRITHLSLKYYHGAMDLTSRVWGLMARGLLPALADLHLAAPSGVSLGGEGGGGLPRALEGVAGTLRRLTIHSQGYQRDPSDAVCYELGVAIGKLQRLTYLSLEVAEDGRFYHFMGRGLAASGGCPPLFELHL